MKNLYFSRQGYKDVLLSDYDLEFNSRAFKEYLKAVDIEHRTMSPYHLQGNGKVVKCKSQWYGETNTSDA